MLLSKVPRGWCHDCLLANYNFAILLQRLPDVVFADEGGGDGCVSDDRAYRGSRA